MILLLRSCSLGMGVERLSMASPSLPRVKRAIRVFSRQRAQELSAAALSADDVTEVHRLLEDAFEKAGLGSLLGPGQSQTLTAPASE